MNDLVRFLTARLDEQEALIPSMECSCDGVRSAGCPDFVATDIEAKRAVLARFAAYQEHHISDDFSGDRLVDEVLGLFAAAYSGHLEFEAEWVAG